MTQPVQLVDLYPTLAELAGVTPDRDYLHGRSLLPLMRGEPLAPVAILAQAGGAHSTAIVHDGWKLIESYPGRTRMSTRLSHRRVRAWLAERHPELADFVIGAGDLQAALAEVDDPGALWRELVAYASDREAYYELFDLRNDPGETVNLAETEPERVEQLLGLLERERARVERTREALAPRAEDLGEASEAELDELRKLGYTE